MMNFQFMFCPKPLVSVKSITSASIFFKSFNDNVDVQSAISSSSNKCSQAKEDFVVKYVMMNYNIGRRQVEMMDAVSNEEMHTIDDIYSLSEGERAELFDGKIYYMAPPSTNYQRLLNYISTEINLYIRKNNEKCEVFPAPFAVFRIGTVNESIANAED